MRELSDIGVVGVVGAGTMGNGIAGRGDRGYEVVMRDIESEYVERGLDSIDDSLARLDEKGRLDEDPAAIRDRIEGPLTSTPSRPRTWSSRPPSNLDVKKDIFADLDGVTDDDVVLATNTSTLSITTIASATDRASDVIGLHFMNPVPIMDGVEVVVGERTADPVVDFAHAFAEDLGKETWEADDKPGFVTTGS